MIEVVSLEENIGKIERDVRDIERNVFRTKVRSMSLEASIIDIEDIVANLKNILSD